MWSSPMCPTGDGLMLRLKKEAVMYEWIESQDWSELIWLAGWLAALLFLGIALSISGKGLRR